MENKWMIIEEIALDYDLERIRKLALPEKFKLVNHAKLVYLEALYANREGIQNLVKSPNYTANKTYNLFAMLLVNGIHYEKLEEIIYNYAQNFEKSDTYYAQIVFLGVGVLMIDKQFAPESIYLYLMSLLGEDFLLNNLKFTGCIDEEEAQNFSFEKEVVYKPFEGKMRKIKYDLLAMLHLRDTKGLAFVSRVINDFYGDSRLRFYFNMLNTGSEDVMDYLYGEFRNTPTTEAKLKIFGAYQIIKGADVFSSHYLFNAIIGKYSRYDKDSKEIEQELTARMDEILAKVHE